MIELSNLFMYASGRIVLGAYRTPTAVGLYEGPVRAHNLLYALGGALAVPTVPTASRYVATGDERRLRELAVRGSRYTLALFVPLCVTLMALAEPILGVWLGERYTGGATALTILVAYWLLYGALVVTPGFLVGVGRAPQVARLMVVLAVSNLALALVLTPELGVEGPALATTIPFVLAFPLMLRNGLLATGVSRLRAGAPRVRAGLRARCAARGDPRGDPPARGARRAWPRSASSRSPACWRAGPPSTCSCSTRASAP